MCIVIDLDVVCLVCLHHSQKMHGIFAPDTDTPELQIAHKISTLSKLKVNADNESLPDKICESCLEDLRAAWRFHKNCQTAAVVFHSIFRPKSQRERVVDNETSDVQEKYQDIASETNSKQQQYSSNAVHDVDCNESIIEVPDDAAALDESQNVHILESPGDVQLHKDITSELLDIEQAIVEEDYLSAPETIDEESDLVEYYLTDEGLQDVELTRGPSTSKADEKLSQGVNSSNKSLLKTRDDSSDVLPSISKIKERKRMRDHAGNSKAQPKIKLKTNLSQTLQHNSDNDEDFDLISKSKKLPAPTKRSSSPEPKAPKICELCGNSYRYQHALNAHMRRHFQEKPFPCELCDKAFVSNVELRRHIRVHTGHKPYACQYCDRRFSDFGSRSKHERTHTGERPYQCGTCGKSFAYAHVLSVHIRTHTGEKRFQCELCPKGFTKKAYLIAHMYHHKPAEKEEKAQEQHTTSEHSMDGTISETGEGNDMPQPLRTQKFDDCVYTMEYINDGGDATSHDGIEDAQEDDDANCILIQEENITEPQTERDAEKDNGGIDEVVDVHFDKYTIRVLKNEH